MSKTTPNLIQLIVYYWFLTFKTKFSSHYPKIGIYNVKIAKNSHFPIKIRFSFIKKCVFIASKSQILKKSSDYQCISVISNI